MGRHMQYSPDKACVYRFLCLIIVRYAYARLPDPVTRVHSLPWLSPFPVREARLPDPVTGVHSLPWLFPFPLGEACEL